MTLIESQVINHVAPIKGCMFATIAYFTNCGFPKKSGLQNVQKYVVAKSEQINYDYENAVKSRAEKEVGTQVNFVAQSLPFGHYVKGLENKVIEHNGEYYLRFYEQKNAVVEVTYFENGQPCDQARVAQIKAYIASKGKPTSGTQAAVGLTQNQVKPKALKINNICYLTCNGQTTTNAQLQAPIAC